MRRPGNNSFEMPEFIQSHSMRVPVSLRPLTGADYDEWNEVRWRNDAWLKPWESGDPLHGAPITYKEWMKQLRRNERAGTGAVFAIEQHGRIVGQISLGAICYGAMRSGVVGYWVDERCAGVATRRWRWRCWRIGPCSTRPDLDCIAWKSTFCRKTSGPVPSHARSEQRWRGCGARICTSTANGAIMKATY